MQRHIFILGPIWHLQWILLEILLGQELLGQADHPSAGTLSVGWQPSTLGHLVGDNLQPLKFLKARQANNVIKFLALNPFMSLLRYICSYSCFCMAKIMARKNNTEGELVQGAEHMTGNKLGLPRKLWRKFNCTHNSHSHHGKDVIKKEKIN